MSLDGPCGPSLGPWMVLVGAAQGVPWFCGSNWPELSRSALRPLLPVSDG